MRRHREFRKASLECVFRVAYAGPAGRNYGMLSNRPGAALVGRDVEQAFMLQALNDGIPVVTVTGPAGIGKSALAAQVVHRARASGSLYVAACDTSLQHDEAGLRGALAHALRLPDAESAVLEGLASLGPALVWLDGFERLVGTGAAAALERWSSRIPELQLLLTSRERARLPGEVVCELATLTVPSEGAPLGDCEAGQLWLERVRAHRPDYAPDESESGLVRQILLQLDGLPLAIELAAARIGTLRSAELLARLERPFDVLTSRGRGASLRASIDGSWALLDEAERAALMRLSVLRGRISADAAEAMLAGLARPPLELLQALREKSLLMLRPGETLGMYTSIRKYAEEKLDETGGAAAAHARQAEFFVAQAERAAHSLVERPMDAERDNVLAVLERELAAGTGAGMVTALRLLVAVDEPHWALDGSPATYLRWFDRAIDHPQFATAPPSLRARARIARGRSAWRVGRRETSERDLAAAVDLSALCTDLRLECVARRFHALTMLLAGALDESEHEAGRALELAKGLDDARLRGMAGSILVFVARLRGEQNEARRRIDAALLEFRTAGDVPFELSMQLELVYVCLDAGERELAHAYAEQAIALHRRLDIPDSARLLFGLGHAALEAGEAERAELHYRDAAAAARRSGEATWEAAAMICAAVALFERGQLVAACVELREYLPQVHREGTHLYTGLLDAVAAVFEAACGRQVVAEELLRRAEPAILQDAHKLAFELCRIYVALAGGGAEDETREQFTALLASARAPATRWVVEARILARLLAAPPPVATSTRTLRLAADAHWFEPPDGARISCGTRPVMRRMLLALAAARRDQGRVVSAAQLIDACWPGERIQLDAARNRLHVMLTRARALGLRDVIGADERGYFFTTEVQLSEM